MLIHLFENVQLICLAYKKIKIEESTLPFSIGRDFLFSFFTSFQYMYVLIFFLFHTQTAFVCSNEILTVDSNGFFVDTHLSRSCVPLLHIDSSLSLQQHLNAVIHTGVLVCIIVTFLRDYSDYALLWLLSILACVPSSALSHKNIQIQTLE